MGMKKSYKKIAMVSAFALSVGFAGNAAAAAVTLDAESVDPLKYAEEITIATSVDLVDSVAGVGGVQDMTFELNKNAIPASTDLRVTITLSNGATFATAPTATDINDTAAAAQAFGVLTGGLDESTVTFSGNTGDGFAAGRTFTVEITDINVLNHADVTATVEVLVADNFGQTVLTSISAAPYITFEPALVMTVAPQDKQDLIDVTQESVFFDKSDGDVDTVLGTVRLLYAAKLTTASVDTVDAAALISNLAVTYTAENGLSAFDQDGGSIDDAVGTFAIDGTSATDDTAAASAYDTAKTVTFTVPTDNTVKIDASPVTVSFEGTAVSGYDADSSTGTKSLAPLAKNGSVYTANFALAPGGVYNNYVRISNTSGVDGLVFITLYQDDGTASSSFKLSDVDATFSDILVGQSSSAQMTIQQLFDASGLAAGYTGKLRIVAEGEFSGINIQTYTVSLDGNNFSTF